MTDTVTVPTGQIVNFGVANLYNTSNARVTIRAIKLIAPSGPAIRDITYQAYTARDAVAGMTWRQLGRVAQPAAEPPAKKSR